LFEDPTANGTVKTGRSILEQLRTPAIDGATKVLTPSEDQMSPGKASARVLDHGDASVYSEAGTAMIRSMGVG